MLKKNQIFLIGFIILISTFSVASLYITIIQNIPDNIPPKINIIKPIEGATLSDRNSIIFTATDQQGFITKTQILIDGVIVQVSSFFYDWDTNQIENGLHYITCKAKDKTIWGSKKIHIFVNNTEEIDNIPPKVTIISPIANSTVSNTISIIMDATDVNEIESYKILIDGKIKAYKKSFYWDTTQEIDGFHEIQCEAKDSFNNTGFDLIFVNVNNSQINSSKEFSFKLMTYNIKNSGEDPSYPDWKSVVKEENADIIMFLETGFWDDNDNEKLNLYLNEFNSYFAEEDPYIGYCTQGIIYGTDGAAVMSRFPIISYNQLDNVVLDKNSNYDVAHDFFDIEININGEFIHLIGSHLKAMTGTNNEQKRELEQEGIINYMDNLGNVPIIYLGDLNSFSPEDWNLNTIQSGLGYGPLSMMIKPYINPENNHDYSSHSSSIHNWTDVFRTLNSNDWGITFPSYNSRIDFIYVNQFLSPNIINSTIGDTNHAFSGSDHLTVDVCINLS